MRQTFIKKLKSFNENFKSNFSLSEHFSYLIRKQIMKDNIFRLFIKNDKRWIPTAYHKTNN
jgi:hypothetical protein